MGLEASLKKLFTTRYYLELGDGMIENEFDHVFIATSDETPHVNSDEVMDQRFASKEEIERELQKNPEDFTEWFKVIWQEYTELERHLPKEEA
jgi:isopentenyl-diphosphate delta-isomerase